jgi:Domain of unknown function (DUF4365)
MATLPRDKTPQRTTEHIIADLSVNYVERLFLEAGHSPMGVPLDYGYDVTVTTHRRGGYVESGIIYLQLKASRRLRRATGKAAYTFSISRKHYALWRDEPMPVFLLRYCRHRNGAYWLYLQPYFRNNPKLFKKPNQKSATIYIPTTNKLDLDTIRYMRARKKEAVRAANQAVDHRD